MEGKVNKIIGSWGHKTFFGGSCVREEDIREGISWLYSSANKRIKEIIILDSPLECQTRVNMLGSSAAWPLECQIWKQIEANMWELAWSELWRRAITALKTSDQSLQLSALGVLITRQVQDILRYRGIRFYTFSEDNLLSRFGKAGLFEFLSAYSLAIRKTVELKRYLRFLKAGCFLSLFFENIAVLCRRPEHTNLNSRGKLHRDGGAALEWRDGWKLFYLNGVLVPEDVAVTPAESLDPAIILRERNIEVRKEIVRKIGIERILQKLGGRIVDAWNSYELVSLNMPGMRIEPTYLKMQNPSTGTFHVEGVPPNITTCRGALSWRVGGLKWNPKQLT
jgi:hypothetical protein